MTSRAFVSSVVLAFACASYPVSSATLHVWQDSPSPIAPYTNWVTAAHVIQHAVDAAADDDTVLVTNGVYASSGQAVYLTMTNRVAVDKSITVRSVNGPALTIILGAEAPGGGNGEGAIRCAYVGNHAVLSGFGLTNGHTLTDGDWDSARSGGGVFCELSGTVTNCVLAGNAAESFGGGAFGGTITHCTLAANSAHSGGGASDGTLVNCVLRGNSATRGGGTMLSVLYNCTVTGNGAAQEGGGTVETRLYNCIVYFNTASHEPNHYSSTFHYSCTTPLLTTDPGNITTEPAFLNAAAANYRLAAGSPCIDAGTNLSATITNDLDGKRRPLDGNGDGTAAFDMGAYEFGVALEISLVEPGNKVTLSWVASPGENYALEESATLAPPNWIGSPNGSMNPVTIDVSGQEKYWRLWHVPNNMVWIPPGTFTMGSPETEAMRASDETRHEVTFSQGFWTGKYEVTQGEYLDVVQTNPSFFRNGTTPPAGGTGGLVTNELLHPVEDVSWVDAANYCALVTERERAAGRLPEGYLYRLPTEAEWEYACRAGTTTSHHYGDELRSGMANFDGTWEYDASIGAIANPEGIHLGRTTEVGCYAPNAWGLYDMHGNVYEWCADWYGAYPGGSVTDPQGATTGLDRVFRGGSWFSFARDCRSALRNSDVPGTQAAAIGFRTVLAPGQP